MAIHICYKPCINLNAMILLLQILNLHTCHYSYMTEVLCDGKVWENSTENRASTLTITAASTVAYNRKMCSFQ